MTIVIPGTPIAKRRPRFARRGKFVVTYSDQQTEEGRFLLLVREQWGRSPIEGPVELRADFIMPIPKSGSRKTKELMAAGLSPHVKKPDLDNLVKFVKDCLNETVWCDDSQVVKLEARKGYGENPRTIIEIIE